MTLSKQLPSDSVDCVITSPPYWGLRDYGVDNQIGLEPTIEEYIEKITQVFREVKRVLKPTGTLWLNMGDAYNSNPCHNGKSFRRDRAEIIPRRNINQTGLKPKDLVGMPWRVAFALQAEGWYLRSDIIWAKPNPMPESVTDRPTKAHEYVFLMSKNKSYFYDADAVREDGPTYIRKPSGYDQDGQKRTDGSKPYTGKGGFADDTIITHGRNKRTVWEIATQPYSEAHFATFPEKLVEPCILAGTREGGLVLDPFMGSGTVALVAHRLDRDFIGFELSEEYCEIANRRIRAEVMQERLFV